MVETKGFQSITILNCAFTKIVGGSFIRNSDEIVINQTTFEENRKTAITLQHYQNIFTIYNCKFLFNTDDDSGAAIYSQVNKPLTIQRSAFISNQAKIHEGAIKISSNNLRVIDSKFMNNSALTGDGGAIHIHSNEMIRVTDSMFWNNSTLNGGARWIENLYEFFPSILYLYSLIGHYSIITA